jgi:hypothetical protein
MSTDPFDIIGQTRGIAPGSSRLYAERLHDEYLQKLHLMPAWKLMWEQPTVQDAQNIYSQRIAAHEQALRNAIINQNTAYEMFEHFPSTLDRDWQKTYPQAATIVEEILRRTYISSVPRDIENKLGGVYVHVFGASSVLDFMPYSRRMVTAITANALKELPLQIRDKIALSEILSLSTEGRHLILELLCDMLEKDSLHILAGYRGSRTFSPKGLTREQWTEVAIAIMNRDARRKTAEAMARLHRHITVIS